MKNSSRILTVASLLSLFGASAAANTIVSSTGAPYAGIGFGTNVDRVMMTSWDMTSSYQNVTVSADLGGEGTISAYLTTQIGPSATSATELATTTINALSFNGYTDLFTGLTLGPGTYYLVLTGTQAPDTNFPYWASTSAHTATTDAGVTLGTDGITDIVGDGGTPDNSYAPASTFNLNTTLTGFFTVTGSPATSVPEPGYTVPLLAFILVGLARRSLA